METFARCRAVRLGFGHETIRVGLPHDATRREQRNDGNGDNGDGPSAMRFLRLLFHRLGRKFEGLLFLCHLSSLFLRLTAYRIGGAIRIKNHDAVHHSPPFKPKYISRAESTTSWMRMSCSAA